MIVKTFNGDFEVEPLAVFEPFAVHHAVTFVGVRKDRFSVSHMASGRVIDKASYIDGKGELYYHWWKDLDAAKGFAKRLADILEPGDLYQDKKGWRASVELAEKRNALLSEYLDDLTHA